MKFLLQSFTSSPRRLEYTDLFYSSPFLFLRAQNLVRIHCRNLKEWCLEIKKRWLIVSMCLFLMICSQTFTFKWLLFCRPQLSLKSAICLSWEVRDFLNFTRWDVISGQPWKAWTSCQMYVHVGNPQFKFQFHQYSCCKTNIGVGNKH